MIDLLDQELFVRLGCFLLVLGLLLLGERFFPRRPAPIPQTFRRLTNLCLVAVAHLSLFIVRLLVPVTPVGAALIAEQAGWGLLTWIALFPAWPPVLPISLSILLLDLLIYWQHRAFHHIPWLWRLHRVHHSDVAFDVTTGVRFHPLEILLSWFLKILVILLFGIPALAVLLFEILLNATSLFNHSNIALPMDWDRTLRRWIVTPDMHRVHHSVHLHETDSNFGFNVPWWDYAFGSYCAHPRDGHIAMQIGLAPWRDGHDTSLLSLLSQPFRDQK